MNELLFFVSIVISIGLLTLFYKTLGKTGLYISIVLNSLISFILIFRTTVIYGFHSLVNIPYYVSIFMALYILVEKENKNNIKKAINMAFATTVLVAIILVLSTYFIPIVSDSLAIDMKLLFQGRLRLVAIYPFILIASLYSSIYFYKLFKKEYDNTFISTILTAILIQLLDTIIIVSIGYLSYITNDALIQLSLVSYAYKLMIFIIYIPIFSYLLKIKKVEL